MLPTLAKPGLLVMDVDATLIEEEVIDLLGAESGCGDEMSLITARAMRGEITFDDSLRLRVKMLRGLNIGECKKRIIPKIHVTKGANILIDELSCARLESWGSFWRFSRNFGRITAEFEY